MPPNEQIHDIDAILQRNLTALRRHRPELLAQLDGVSNSGRFRLIPDSQQRVSVGQLVEGAMRPMMPNNDPDGHLRSATRAWSLGHLSVALVGLGDGSALSLLARVGEPDATGRKQAVVVMDPEVELLIACLHVHDLSGSDGPLADPRFLFCVGSQWEKQLQQIYEEPQGPGFPSLFVSGGFTRFEITSGLQRVYQKLAAHELESVAKAKRWYETQSASYLARVLTGKDSRAPRILLLVGRFTTVLKHTGAQLQQAFEGLGCEARILTGRSDFEPVGRRHFLAAVVAFRPDLVVSFDRLRSHLCPSLPQELPVLSWIQDDFPMLACTAAGRSLQSRDFVWLPWPEQYQALHDYPQKQLLLSHALTRTHTLPPAWPPPAADLTYFSHASQTPEEMLTRTLQRADSAQLDVALVERLSQALLEHYAGTGQVDDLFDFVGMMEPSLGDSRACRFEIQRASTVNSPDRVARHLEHPAIARYAGALSLLHGFLHRRQALLWVRNVVEARGLRFHLYGHGWDKDATYAKYARGAADATTEVLALMQQSRATLHLEPWSVVSHWRGLDSIGAGVPVLCRRFPLYGAFVHLARALESANASHCASLEQALSVSDKRHHPALLQAAYGAQQLPLGERDAVAHLRSLRAASDRCADWTLPRELKLATFDSPASLGERVDELLSQPEEARRRALRMRQEVLAHYTYASAARRVLVQIAARLRQEEPNAKLQAPGAGMANHSLQSRDRPGTSRVL